MNGVTQRVADYVNDKCMSIHAIAEKTGISYKVLYPSLRQVSARKLRAEEFLAVCKLLEIDPMQFYEQGKTE